MPKPRRRPTSADVASRAGVSRTTVSLVLNERSESIPEATRRRVFEAARALGYHPDHSARGLAGGQSQTLALVLRQTPEQVAGDALLAETLRGLATAARSASFRVLRGDAAQLIERVSELDRRRLAAQPRGRNAGSIFKNTPEHPAWRLIDQVGLRGHRLGDAMISSKHANFFVNAGRARAADVKALIDLARERVMARFGVEMELEVGLVGEGF